MRQAANIAADKRSSNCKGLRRGKIAKTGAAPWRLLKTTEQLKTMERLKTLYPD